MATVRMTIPTMLATLVRGERRFPLEGETVAEVLAALVRRHPELKVHLFDESGEIREHVMCFHNDDGAAMEAPVAEGDTVTILQAVSGGA